MEAAAAKRAAAAECRSQESCCCSEEGSRAREVCSEEGCCRRKTCGKAEGLRKLYFRPTGRGWCIAAPVSAEEISFGTSGSFSKGKYGGLEATELSVVSASATATVQEWEVSTSLPNLQIEVGTGEELSLGGVLIRFRERQKISGIGDVVLTASRTIGIGSSLPFYLDVEGQLKLPTGRSDLSSGKIVFGYPRNSINARPDQVASVAFRESTEPWWQVGIAFSDPPPCCSQLRG